MKKTNMVAMLVLLVAFSLAGLTGCTDKSTASAPVQQVGVSAVKANPDQYLGQITITGLAGNIYPDDGVFEIADEKACCAIYLFTPFQEKQKESLGTNALYKGSLPERDRA